MVMKKLLIIALLSLLFVGCGQRYSFEWKEGQNMPFSPEISSTLWRFDHWFGSAATLRKGGFKDVE